MDAIRILSYSGAAQAFRVLLKYPRREFSIRELAKEAGAPFSSVLRAVRMMEGAGLVEVGKVGRSSAVRLRPSPYTEKVAGILEAGISPQKFALGGLKEILGKDRGVREAWLFGSVARGEEGPESDIDVAILAGKGYDVADLVLRAMDELGVKVMPLLFRARGEMDAFLGDKERERLK